jgi:hypothetical protein
MALKSEIRKAINSHGKYACVKVWEIEVSDADYISNTYIMRIEVEVRKRKAHPKKNNPK